jgi:hypothetical protein
LSASKKRPTASLLVITLQPIRADSNFTPQTPTRAHLVTVTRGTRRGINWPASPSEINASVKTLLTTCLR